MKDIKCPSCGETFRIDPSSFEEILLQIKDEEFNKQIKERLLFAEEDNKKALEILKRELKIELIEQNQIKDWLLISSFNLLISLFRELILFVAWFFRSFREFVFFSSAIFNLDSRA